MPLSSEPQLQPAARLLDAKPLHWLYVIGRLKPPAATAPIEAQLTPRFDSGSAPSTFQERGEISHSTQSHPSGRRVSSMRDAVAPTLRLLQVLAAAVLLIAWPTSQPPARTRDGSPTEPAVRVALGASRGRLIGQSFSKAPCWRAQEASRASSCRSPAGHSPDSAAPRHSRDPSPSWLVIAFAVGASLGPAHSSASPPRSSCRGRIRSTHYAAPRGRCDGAAACAVR